VFFFFFLDDNIIFIARFMDGIKQPITQVYNTKQVERLK